MLWHRVPADPTAHLWRRPDDAVTDPPGTVGDVMTRTVVTMSAGADAADLAQTMLECDVRSIPIVEGSTVVGIVSRRDLLRTLVRRDDTVAAEIQHRLDQYAAGARRWHVQVADGIATVTGVFGDDAEEKVVRILTQSALGVSAVHVHRSRKGAQATP